MSSFHRESNLKGRLQNPPGRTEMKKKGSIVFYAWAFAGALVLAGITNSTWAERIGLDGNQRSSDAPRYRVLFFGNSHTAFHDLPSQVARMVASDSAEETIEVALSQQLGFLDDVWKSPKTRTQIESKPWTHAILQAQKYSQSGKYQYSTAEAVEMAKFLRSRNIEVVFYPEWGQRGNAEEGKRIHQLHSQMAKDADADVAPVGLAWDIALTKDLKAPLHAADGNHASEAGAFLTSAVLYAMLTGRSPLEIRDDGPRGMSSNDRKMLLDAAEEATAAVRNKGQN